MAVVQDNPLKKEKEYVHDVYSQIADHFSDTRFKPWPRIAEFLTSLPSGSLVADIGCGNGKYLGVNKSLYMLGSDICPKLVAIAKGRGHEVMTTDCLSLPYRSGIFDAGICIAVLHHISTEERRVEAVREMVRVVRPGGQVLVYVWAMEQNKKKFETQDVMVPWHLQPRYTRGFEDGCGHISNTKKKRNRKKKERIEESENNSSQNGIDHTHSNIDHATSSDHTRSNIDYVTSSDHTHSNIDYVTSSDHTHSNTDHVTSSDYTYSNIDHVTSSDHTHSNIDHVTSSDHTHLNINHVSSSDHTPSNIDHVSSSDHTRSNIDHVTSSDHTRSNIDHMTSGDHTHSNIDHVSSSDLTRSNVDDVSCSDNTRSNVDHVTSSDHIHLNVDHVTSSDHTHLNVDHVTSSDHTKISVDHVTSSDHSHHTHSNHVSSSDQTHLTSPDTKVLNDSSKGRCTQLTDLGYKTYYRYYHVFCDKELVRVCECVPNVRVVEHWYDHENWCILLERTY